MLAGFCRDWEVGHPAEVEATRDAAISIGESPGLAAKPLDESTLGRAAHGVGWLSGRSARLSTGSPASAGRATSALIDGDTTDRSPPSEMLSTTAEAHQFADRCVAGLLLGMRTLSSGPHRRRRRRAPTVTLRSLRCRGPARPSDLCLIVQYLREVRPAGTASYRLSTMTTLSVAATGPQLCFRTMRVDPLAPTGSLERRRLPSRDVRVGRSHAA